jgi:hypothetical protein
VPEQGTFWSRNADRLEQGFRRTSPGRLSTPRLQSLVIDPLRAAATMDPAAGHAYLTELTSSYDRAGIGGGRLASRLMVPTVAAMLVGIAGVAMFAGSRTHEGPRRSEGLERSG